MSTMVDRMATAVFTRRVLAAAAVAAAVSGCAGVSEVSNAPMDIRTVVRAAQPGDCHGSHHSYTVKGRRYWIQNVPAGHLETGMASWYGRRFHGKKTASGEVFDMHRISAAHKTLPLFSIVRVINLANGNEVTVRINDRGPFAGDRLIDLSYAAAKKLKMVSAGVAPVQVIVTRTPRDNKLHAALESLARIN